MSDSPPRKSSISEESPFEVPRVDSEKMRSAVAAKLFGGEAAPVRIGPYTVLSRLGAGGMGVVYAAYDEQLDRKIAIKVMHGRALSQVHEGRLRSEAQALAKLSDPNVVSVYEVGTFRGQVFLAMEFLPGKTLASLRRDAELSQEAQLQPWIGAAKGLLAAHRVHIVHRDFKPANAMCLPDGRVKVFDFGLAIQSPQEQLDAGKEQSGRTATQEDLRWDPSQTTHRDESTLNPQTKTMTGALVGTPAYMSPEQLSGERPDERSDQFSFCVALWEYWTKSLPFAGQSRAELLSAMQAQNLAPVRRGSMPGWLRAILVKGLALDPKQRFDSMQTLVAALERGLAKKRRRRWAVAAVLPLVAGVGLSAHGLSRPDPCEGLTAHWDELSPASLLHAKSEALRQEKDRFATDTFAQIVRDLTRYVDRGREAHVYACQQAMQDPQVGAAGFAAQSGCYIAGAQAVSSYMTRLSVAGAKELRPELWRRQGLPSLSACAQMSTKPTAQGFDSQHAKIEESLAQAQVAHAFFDHDKAIRFAQQAIDAAGEIEDNRQQGRGHLLLAQTLSAQGNYDQARKAVDRAYRMAEQVSDPGLRLEAAVTRAYLMIRQGQPQEAGSQLRDVYPLAMRSDIDAERRLKYFAVGCRSERASFNLCEAHRNCVEGLKLMQNEPGSVPTRNRIFRRLAWLYLDAGLIQKSLDVSARAQAELLAAVGADSQLNLLPELSHLTIQGEYLRTQGKDPAQIEKLLPAARRLHQRYVETYGDTSSKVISVRTNLAELLRWSGHLDEARPLFESLLSTHPKDPGRYYTLVAYGQLRLAQKDLEAGTKALKEGLAVIEATRSRSAMSGEQTMIPEEAEALFALAKAQGHNKKGLALAKKALQVYESLQSADKRPEAKSECAELGQGLDLYQRERALVQAWIAS